MDSVLEQYALKAIQVAQENGCKYCDVRAEEIKQNVISIENGEVEYSQGFSDRGLGIRILGKGKWGFYSISEPKNAEEIISGVKNALKSASIQSEYSIKLANIPTHTEKVDFPLKEVPDTQELIKLGIEVDKTIQQEKHIIKSTTNIGYKITSKLFVSSEGSHIEQNYTDTIADMSAAAHDDGITQSVNITEGGRGGVEKITKEKNIFDSAKFVAKKASELIYAKPAKEDTATVVMNPDFVALLTHEILGHPSEADRVMGKEMAWAGGAWWAGKLGEKIGSEHLNVVDDPTIQGSLGCYAYDDEGVKTSKTQLIKKGMLTNHMQNRETGVSFDVNPTANMRATSYKFLPLIRMACTCIEPGEHNPQEMIQDVKDGYYISNMKVPSIDFKRYNWSISCQYAQKIENGELTDLLRDVIVLGTAPEFFKSIDACGNDFTIRPITNCGKGDPMQSMMMGNGGPTIRAKASIKSVGE